MSNKYLLYIATILFSLIISLNVYAVDKDTSQKELFQKKCTTCHPAQLALKKKATKKQISDSVKRMQAKQSSDISDADAEKIIQYISKVNGAKADQK